MTRICWALLLNSVFVTFTVAQVTMTPAYSAYNSFRYDITTGRTYSTSYISGTSYGSCNNPNGIGCSSIVHTLSSRNVISGPSGTNPNPYAYISGAPFAYLSLSNTQSLAQNPGDTLTDNIYVQASCSYAGFLQGFSFNFQIKLAYTKSHTTSESSPAPDGSVRCSVVPWCTAETTPPICNPSSVVQQPLIVGMTAKCYNYYHTEWLAERWSSSVPWTCIPLIPGQNGVGTQESSRYACTK